MLTGLLERRREDPDVRLYLTGTTVPQRLCSLRAVPTPFFALVVSFFVRISKMSRILGSVGEGGLFGSG